MASLEPRLGSAQLAEACVHRRCPSARCPGSLQPAAFHPGAERVISETGPERACRPSHPLAPAPASAAASSGVLSRVHAKRTEWKPIPHGQTHGHDLRFATASLIHVSWPEWILWMSCRPPTAAFPVRMWWQVVRAGPDPDGPSRDLARPSRPTHIEYITGPSPPSSQVARK